MYGNGQAPIFILKEGVQRTRGRSAQSNNIAAAKAVADAVRSTLGPKGMDKMLVDSMGDVVITNDGATILKEMDIEHPAAKGTRDEYVQQASIKREQSMYRTLDSLQKQSRLPKRAPPKSDVLNDFKINGNSVDSFIHSEEKRLFRQKEIATKPKKLDKKTKQEKITLSNRPRNQKSLTDFPSGQKPREQNNWWKPVLDGSITSPRDVESRASEAAKDEALSQSLENEKHCTITIDHREGNSTLPSMLKLRGHEIKIESLPVGDIRISNRVIIERKTARDLVDSIIDGRLVNQARRLRDAAEKPLLIVESLETERLHPNAVQGAMAWITLDLGLPVLMTGSPEQTARFVSVAAKREARILDLLISSARRSHVEPEKSAIKAASEEIMAIISGEENEGILPKKWDQEVVTKRINILAELPGIGPITASKIMDEAGDIMGLCHLSERQLTSIEGVSSIQARDLFRFLHG